MRLSACKMHLQTLQVHLYFYETLSALHGEQSANKKYADIIHYVRIAILIDQLSKQRQQFGVIQHIQFGQRRIISHVVLHS